MRSAMIWVSVLLAIYLAWPLVFGKDGNRTLEAVAEASVARAPAPQTRLVAEAAIVRADASPRPESCYKRYQREVKQCDGADSAGCRLGAADHWDMCEATGFWPD